jgi:metal-sulfur cluster biosynthetic enzyme
MLWMGDDGKLQLGGPPLDAAVAAVGFANRESQDAFVAMFLEHRAEDLPELNHALVVNPNYRWHGAQWERYPLPVKHLPAGAVLHQKNAYAVLPFTAEDGPRRIEALRSRLMTPLAASAGDLDADTAAVEWPGRLARPGEAGDSPIPKRALWEALADCKDEQFYKAGISVVDLGLVYDLRVRGETVEVVMAMPHRGRPRVGYFAQGSGGNSTPVRQRLLQVPGVKDVVVKQTWEPGWNSNRLTDAGRRKLGLPALTPAANP